MAIMPDLATREQSWHYVFKWSGGGGSAQADGLSGVGFRFSGVGLRFSGVGFRFSGVGF